MSVRSITVIEDGANANCSRAGWQTLMRVVQAFGHTYQCDEMSQGVAFYY